MRKKDVNANRDHSCSIFGTQAKIKKARDDDDDDHDDGDQCESKEAEERR